MFQLSTQIDGDFIDKDFLPPDTDRNFITSRSITNPNFPPYHIFHTNTYLATPFSIISFQIQPLQLVPNKSKEFLLNNTLKNLQNRPFVIESQRK